ncbi:MULTISPECIES: porin [unclassified Paraburkholderia]|uniref:porin n=1 Tax=unclassified Paraburkholderia TaxID=2615204 RepID=UPI0017D19E03|nr:MULTISPECIES: porin [unclassified Paraburkholderia]MBB5409020.1 putative porin [Paraburkholderia sp. HC6.4b]MBB5450748.1 putative porin [Paraburkholderia sp. Kb1A]
MKASRLFGAAIAMMLANVANAQSGATLYGIIDAGFNYVSNLKTGNGAHAFMLSDGPPQASRFGLKGAEDIGAGNKVIFQLENGFSVANGNLGQGGRIFGRLAWVGMSGQSWGKVTLGRQYDPVVDYLYPLTSCGTYGGGYMCHPFDSDNIGNDFRVNNSVKYTSPNLGGFTFGTMYGMSNQAGGFKQNRAYSVGGSYANGPIYLGAAFEQLDNPGTNADGAVSSNADAPFVAARQRIYGAGGTYTIGPVKLAASWARTVLDGIKSGPIVSSYLRLDNYEVNATYTFTPSVLLSGGYYFTSGNQASATGDLHPKWHEFNVMLDYILSKRTDVFAMAIYQKAAGDATFASIYAIGPTATEAPGSARQTVVRLGIRHKF